MNLNLFQFVDKSKKEPRLLGEKIHLPEATWLGFSEILRNPIEIAYLKELSGNVSTFEIKFSGNIFIKIGINSKEKSFIWCLDKTIASEKIKKEYLNIDISKFNSGVLEIHIYALKESYIYEEVNIAKENKINFSNLLYNFVSPNYNLCTEETLYYKFTGNKTFYSFDKKNIYIQNESSVSLLTYFNSFSVEKWKKYTNIEHISAYIDILGKGRVEIIHIGKYGSNIISVWKFDSKLRNTFELTIGNYPCTGIIGLKIHAEDECILFGGGYLSYDMPTNNVHLGIGITTYHREDYVKESVNRLCNEIKKHPLYNNIEITVVDNGRTLKQEDIPFATLIPNKNLGGTGGFMRSLIHYQDNKTITHCLFMDDDAKCETDSIFRSISFIRHAKNDSIAINGAMLSENIQYIQWESGAWFDRCCHPMHCHYDLRDEKILLENEKEDETHPIYGAWWFFMFPINKVIRYSFPFFVRGDDIEFSYTNNFNIVRMNGIAIWQEDFKIKESPMTLYLDTRSQIMHHLMLEHIDHGAFQIIQMTWKLFKIFNNSYQYDTARAISTAFSDILNGPYYWIKNIDTAEIRKRIKSISNTEITSPLRANYKEIPLATHNIRFPFFTKFIRRVTLNGHLIPSKLLNKNVYRLSKYDMPFSNRVFLRKEIIICNDVNNTEITLTRNTLYFISNIYYMITNSIKFIICYTKLKNEYRSFLASLSTNKFWKDVFNN